jgi:hypothetical protein
MDAKTRTKQVFTIREIKDIFKKQRKNKKIVVAESFEYAVPETSISINTDFFESLYRSSYEKVKELFAHYGAPENLADKGVKGTHWTDKERELFVECLMIYGKDWEAIALKFPNKTVKQLKNFFQNNKDKMLLNNYLKH